MFYLISILTPYPKNFTYFPQKISIYWHQFFNHHSLIQKHQPSPTPSLDPVTLITCSCISQSWFSWLFHFDIHDPTPKLDHPHHSDTIHKALYTYHFSLHFFLYSIIYYFNVTENFKNISYTTCLYFTQSVPSDLTMITVASFWNRSSAHTCWVENL